MWKPRNIRVDVEPRLGRRTLDRKHQDNIGAIAEQEERVGGWERELARLETNFDPGVSIRKRELQFRISNAKKARERYFLDNSRNLFEYFEERQNNKTASGSEINSVKVDAFFFGRRQGINSKDSASDRYRMRMEVEDVISEMDVVKDFRCACGGEMVAIDAEGVRTCRMCGISKPYMSENDRLTYREPPKEVTFYSYQRINHFREILAQFQGQESTTVPDEVYETIKLQLKKERRQAKNLNVAERKELLKKLGYNKYYEHIAYIWNKLGVKPPVVPPALQQQLISLFCNVEKCYAVHCPHDRVNFLHYYYVLYKLFELLGETKYLPEIIMLKDPARTAEQDVTWQKICSEYGWPFIVTT